MTSERKTIVIALLSLVGFVTWALMHHGNQPKTINTENILRVGTAAEFPPFEFIENDKIIGYDIDVVHAIAQHLNKKIDIIDLPFTTLIQQLHMGTIDIIAAGITPTAERAKQVLFTDVYTEGDPLIIVSPKDKASLTSIDDLKGKTVIINDGFSAEIHLTKYPKINLKRLPTVADAFLALRSGQADAFVTARNTLQPFFEQYSADDYNIAELPGTDESAALALAQGNEVLRDAINETIKTLKEDGTIEQLTKKWKLGAQ